MVTMAVSVPRPSLDGVVITAVPWKLGAGMKSRCHPIDGDGPLLGQDGGKR